MGDGAIILVDKTNSFSYLIRPRRYYGNPCLTTTNQAYKAVDIDVIDVPLGNTLILCTDGFLEILRKASVFERLRKCDFKELNNAILSEENNDDCSYISFTRRRK